MNIVVEEGKKARNFGRSGRGGPAEEGSPKQFPDRSGLDTSDLFRPIGYCRLA